MASTKRVDGGGSIYFEASRGKWVGSYVTDWVGGKPVRKKVSGTSKTDVTRKLELLKQKVNSGELANGRPLTVAEWMTYWLDKIAADKVRPSTLRGYRTYVDCYIIPLLGSKRLDKLTPEHIANAWRHLQTEGRPGVKDPTPLSSTSAHQAHRILSRALKVAHQRGHVTRNVATLIDAPQPTQQEIVPLSKADAMKLRAAAVGERNAARWTVALSLGLRQGEALGLTWANVDLDEGTMAVRQSLSRVKGQGLVFGPVKSRAGKRTIKLPTPLLEELKHHRTRQNADRLAAANWYSDHDLVFAREDGRPIDPKIDWRAWKALCIKAGAPDSRLHNARHTAATMLLSMGVPMRVAMEILGHSRITVTQNYQHVVDEMHDDAAEKMAAFWG